MADAVLPKSVFSPAIAMVGAHQHRAIGESLQQRTQLLIHPGKTDTLTAGTFGRATALTTKWHTWAGPTRPRRTFVPIGHVGLTHIQKYKERLTCRRLGQTLIDPGELLSEAPGVACKLKVFKGGAQYGTRGRCVIEPVHGPTANGAITTLAEAFDDVGTTKAKAAFSILTGMAFGLSQGSALPITPGVKPIQKAAWLP